MAICDNRYVYIVDDDDDVRDSIIELLRCAGFEARGFASARDFLDKIDPAASCIILDLHMPDLTGFQTLEILRRQGNLVPVILFSGRSDIASENAARRSSATDLIAKPIEPDVLTGLIQRILSEHAP